MSLSLLSFILLAIAALVCSFISGMTGLGGGTVLLGVIALVVEAGYVVPLHGAVQVVSNGTRVLLFLSHVKWKIIGFFLIGLVPGMVAGLFLFRLLDETVVKLLMGFFILVVTWLPKGKKKMSRPFGIFVPVGLVAGVIGIFFGAIGPFIAVFFVREDVIKEELVATKATCQVVCHILKIPFFGFIGMNVFVHWPVLLGLCTAVIVGTLAGKKMINKVSDATFKKVIKVILTLIALKIIVGQILAMAG
ncbi:MAG: sulfite exporter TauE/SafE family protein [Phycisphaerae bacterium]|nr:sulfite exporter TauE/SafE family protein [Phycisphaerae bacterium]